MPGGILWNRDSKFTKCQHLAMWHVAVGWHAIEFAQKSAILEFYIWFPFPHITAVDMSLCTSLRNFIQIEPPSAEKMTSCRFLRWRISAIDRVVQVVNRQHSSKLLSFWENCVFLHFGIKIQDGGSLPSWILGVPWWVLWKAHVRLPIGRQ